MLLASISLFLVGSQTALSRDEFNSRLLRLFGTWSTTSRDSPYCGGREWKEIWISIPQQYRETNLEHGSHSIAHKLRNRHVI